MYIYTHTQPAHAHAYMHAPTHTPHGVEEWSICAVERCVGVEQSLAKNTSDMDEQGAARRRGRKRGRGRGRGRGRKIRSETAHTHI